LIWSSEELQTTRYDLMKREMEAGGQGVSLGQDNADFSKTDCLSPVSIGMGQIQAPRRRSAFQSKH
jgi:hypothetical protein